MRINIGYVTALLLACVACSGVAGQCGEEQTLKNGVCTDCTTCNSGFRVVEHCSNATDTKCAKNCKDYEIPNSNYECEINCSHCKRGSCDTQQRCVCPPEYFGDICDRKIPTTAPQITPPTETHRPEDDAGNRVVIIISIVCSVIVAVIVISIIIICYVTCSRRSSQNLSESSDESTGSFHSSNSINSRTMLTERSSQSPHRQTTSSLPRDTILPPPKSWNKFTLQ